MVELTVRLVVELKLLSEEEPDIKEFVKYLKCKFYPLQDDVGIAKHSINDYEVVDMSYF